MRKQIIKVLMARARQARQDVTQVSLPVQTIDFCRLDQGPHVRTALATAQGTREQPIVAPM